MECNLLHSNLNINLNLIINLIQKDAVTAAPRLVLDGTFDPAKLTHTINHQIQEAGRGWPGMGVLSVRRWYWSLRAGPASIPVQQVYIAYLMDPCVLDLPSL